MLHEVLYHREPAWIVGEKQAERDVRRASEMRPKTQERYPGDYSGKVISIRSTRDRAQKGLPSLANMADRDHPCVTLDLSASEVLDIRNRASKVSSSVPYVVAVTFDDRWGAAGKAIDAAFGTREAAEAAEMKSDDAFDFDGRRFVEVSGFAAGNLPETVTHTGTGLYSVKATPTQVNATQIGAPAGQVVTFGSPWTERATTLNGQVRIYSLAVFNGKLYGGTHASARLFEWNDVSAWVEVAPNPHASDNSIFALAVFNGKLYGASSPLGRLYEWNGVNAWVLVAPKLGAASSILSLAVYNGKLYGGTEDGQLYEWNDVDAWVEVAPKLGAENFIFALAVYNGKLYGGTGVNGKLYEWNDVNAWVEKAPKLGAETQINSLIVFNSKLYGGTSPNGNLYEWNDVNAWVQKAPQLGIESTILSLAVFNSKLYGGTTANGNLFEWNGVNAWVLKAPTLGTEASIFSLEVYNSRLYGGTGTIEGNLYEWSEMDLDLSGDFSGGYVTNVTRAETRAIISHTSNTVTLEGSLASWADTDDLDIFDAWSTIQAAADQLWTDQGASTFTANQYIRIFAGTYDEVVAPNSGLVASFGTIALIIEGDPTDDRDNIVIAPSSGTALTITGTDYVHVRHLKIAPPNTESFGLRFSTGAQECWASDVHVVGTILNPLVFTFKGEADNCLISTDRDNAGTEALQFLSGGTARNCTIRETAGNNRGEGIECNIGQVKIIGTTIAGFAVGVFAGNSRSNTDMQITNCTIYDCTKAIDLPEATAGIVGLELINTIVSECATVVEVLANAYPQESVTYIGASWILRNNIFHNYTTFATDGVSPKTHAEIIAMNRVDAKGDLDATDPLMTAPGADDFSLQTASPARNAGHGSGVITGINEVAFDPNTPDIGAWSSGVIPTPVVQSPIITAISPNFDGDSFDMTVGQAAGLTVNVYTSPEIPAIFTLEPTTRFGNGDLTITGKTANAVYYVYCVTLDGATLIGVSNIVKVLITTTDTGGLPESVDEDLSVLPGVDLLLRDDTHDLARDSRDIVLVDGSLLVRQRLSIALQLFKGEWFLDADAGVPWLQEILEKGVAVAVIDAILREKIVGTPGVNRILTYSSEIDAATRTVSVAFTVDTVYGPVEFEGALI